MKVYLIEEYGTFDSPHMLHVASTEEKAIEFANKLTRKDRRCYYLTVTEVEIDENYGNKSQREVYRKEGY